MKNTMGAFNSVLVNFMHAYRELWVNYRDNHDINQNYRDMRISVIAQPYIIQQLNPNLYKTAAL